MNAENVMPSADLLRSVMQRIRAGWLPHVVGPAKDSWWWGRPRSGDGFFSWSKGSTPSMSVVERMDHEEVAAWKWSLHPMANELNKEAL